MIALVCALAGATGTPSDLVLWSAPGVDRDGAIYLVTGAGCAGIEVQGDSDAAVSSLCEVLGPVEGGEVLRLLPDPTWPGSLLSVGQLGEAPQLLAVTSDVATAGTLAIPVKRTATDAGVSFELCLDGVISAVVRSEAEPAAPGAPGGFLGPGVWNAYFGTADGSWPEATAQTTATFWFATWDELGQNPGWDADVVTLASAGKVRSDVRFGYDPSGANCPSPGASWALGDEVDAVGEFPTPQAGDSGDAGKGCGCAHDSGPTVWLWLGVGLLGLRRRYHFSSK